MTISETVRIVKRCDWCEQLSIMEVSLSGYEAWKKDTLIQDAFPELSKEEREIIISGYHPKCYDEIFCNPNDCEVHE